MPRRRRRGAASAPADPRLLPRAGAVVAVSIGSRAQTWPTRVEAVEGQAVTVVAPTRPMGPPILPELGTPVAITWPTERGLIRVAGRLAATGHDVVATWTVAVDRTAREQRREAFRLPVALRVHLDRGGGPLDARMRDLSEHGLCCALPGTTAPSVGEGVAARFVLPGRGEVVAAARVVHVVASPGTREVWLGLGFVDHDPARAEALRRFVLDRQLGERPRLRLVR
ncbi:PilZ domain-containing protein [Nitriliruptoraceae bacterium ZYF776]|nr:PilZ domain-containing protein [Profundirhabdus halotolerans]